MTTDSSKRSFNLRRGFIEALVLVLIFASITNAQTASPANLPSVAIGSAFTYQGQLKQSGSAVNAVIFSFPSTPA